MKFRRDINTLRAVAVMAVLIYHFNPKILSGGFVGVDIFFVISGYLMTKIVFEKYKTNSFSFVEFYSARCVRIIPPLAFLCLVLMLFGYFYLTIFDFRILSKHVLSSILFISNINYYMEAGYFDVNSNYKWLLHTWSLSVEWQFYTLFPIYICALNYLLPSRYLKCIYTLTLLILFIYGMYLSNINQSLGFFSLQSRGWELMLGGIAYLYPLNKLAINLKKVLTYFGYFLLLISIVVLSSKYNWPSVYTLIPVLGVFFVIIASTNTPLDSNRLIQGIGTRSYSIYLWHWPIKTVFFYCSLTSPTLNVLGGGVSIIIGMIAYELIEKNTKGKLNKLTLKQFFLFKPLWYVIIISLISFFVYFKNGITERNVPSLLNIKKSPLHSECDRKNCNYFYSDTRWAVLGDSHAKEIAYSLAGELAKIKEGLIEYSYAGCKPSFNFLKNDATDCAMWTEKSVAEIVNNEKIENVVVSYRAFLFENNDKYFESFKQIIDVLSKSKADIYILMPIPSSDSQVNAISFKNNLINNDQISSVSTSVEDYRVNNYRVLEYMNNLKNKKIRLIDTQEYFCDLKYCYSIKNGNPLYFDDNHPSMYITDMIVKSLLIKH